MNQVLVVGANRGIGLAMARLLAKRGDHVVGTCRTPSPEASSAGIELVRDVDVTTDEGRAHLVRATAGRSFDWLVLTAGLLEADRFDSIDASAILRHFEVNALAPLLLARALVDRLPRGGKLALLTSRMGSIEDNTSGGYYAYRMSKAALNAAGKSLAIDLEGRGIHVGILHPGFVRTRMTGHHGNVEPEESARMLVERIDALDARTSGRFFHADGSTLPW